VSRLPSGDAWEYELKLDGYRALAVKHSGDVTLYSRNEKRFNKRYPSLVQALASLPDESVLDGEIVALDESGRPNFHRLQNATVDTPLTFFAFDLLMWEGEDMRERRRVRRMTPINLVHDHLSPAERVGGGATCLGARP
jgi:ATP-dependent DNA ligase